MGSLKQINQKERQMEISTNTAQSTNGYQQTKQKDSSSTDASFDQYMNTQSQKDLQANNTADSKEDYIEVSDTSEQTQTLTYTQDVAKVQTEDYDPNRKFLNFLDENYPNYFEKNGISKEDEKVIRSVLSDDKISQNEVRDISFEQAQTLNKIEFNRFEYGPENADDMMVFKMDNNKTRLTLASTNLTKDDTLNKAIFTTFVENTLLDEDEMFNIIDELLYTLRQAYNGMDLGFNMNQAPQPSEEDSNQFKNSEFNYENHLLKLLSILDNSMSKPNDTKTQKQYELLNTNFGMILDNYKKFQDEEVQLEQ